MVSKELDKSSEGNYFPLTNCQGKSERGNTGTRGPPDWHIRTTSSQWGAHLGPRKHGANCRATSTLQWTRSRRRRKSTNTRPLGPLSGRRSRQRTNPTDHNREAGEQPWPAESRRRDQQQPPPAHDEQQRRPAPHEEPYRSPPGTGRGFQGGGRVEDLARSSLCSCYSSVLLSE